MSLALLSGWLGDAGSPFASTALVHLVLGVCISVLAGLWLWSRWSLHRVQKQARELAEHFEDQAARVQDLEGARWAVDPEARTRRDDDLVQMLGSLLSYTESVRTVGASDDALAADQEGAEPCA